MPPVSPALLQITWTARYGSQAGDIQPAEVQQEVVVSYLPLSHIAAQIYDLWTGIQWGAQVCFAEPDALKVSLLPCQVGVRTLGVHGLGAVLREGHGRSSGGHAPP